VAAGGAKRTASSTASRSEESRPVICAAEEGRLILARSEPIVFQKPRPNVALALTLPRDYIRATTPEELAEKLGMPVEKVRKVLKLAREPLSIETPVGDEEDVRLGDLIEDKNAIQPIDAAIQSNLRETTTRVLASVTPREERVLRMRFGIGMNKDHTLEEVGQQFSVTRERIRQIEAKALRKLKHPSRSRILRSFLDN
jgi:DNA-directed RNA polymerase sigma subunit (sigma70/sigma32)